MRKIVKVPGVCGGSAIIDRTRLAVWILESYRRAGMTEDQLLSNYPSIDQDCLARVWQYVAKHKEEIDAEIEANLRA